jgi:hypothetical protein
MKNPMIFPFYTLWTAISLEKSGRKICREYTWGGIWLELG